MELKEAIEAFERLEARRRKWSDSEDVSPIFNVRLDAMTTNRDMTRGFRIFVRIDGDVPEAMHTDALAFVIDTARELDLTPDLDNGGIELT